MAQRSSPRGEPSGVPVVLCCALGEEAVVEDAARTLRERGLQVDVLVGVELDPRALAAAIDRWRGEGLYVLCRAGALDRVRVDSLREVLLARRVPFGRTLTVGPTTQSELVERVEQGLKKVVPIARAGGSSSAGTGANEGTGVGGRPRRQTIPVIPASVTRALAGAGAAEATVSDAAPTSATSATPAATKPATPKPKSTTAMPKPTPAKPTSARPTSAPRSMPPVPARRIEPAPLPPAANEDTTAGEHAAGNELTSTSEPPSLEEHTIADEAPSAPTSAVPVVENAAAAEETVAGVEAVDGDAEGENTFVGTPDVLVPPPAVEPTQTKRPDTSVTALEVDADLLDDEDEDVTRLRPKLDDDELPSLDLEGMIAAIGDGPDPAARGNTVIARDAAARGDTVIARVNTLKASAVPFDGYPEDAPEISLSDGEVLVDRTMVTPAVRPPPLPAALTTTMPTPKTPAPPEEEATGPSTGKLLVAAVVGALGIGVLVAVLVSNRDGADVTASAESSKSEVVADASKSQPDEAKADAPKPDEPKADEPKPEGTPDDAKADDGAAEAKADDGGEAPPEEPTTNTDAKTEAVQDPAATRPGLASATVKPSAKLPMLARPPAVPPPPRTRVEAALRARELRALDILLVVRKPSRPLAFGDAERYCSGLDVQGIQGWRLPDVGELASLDEAGMLTRGFYWSQTSGDTFGDTHMAWNGRTRQAASRIKGSVALCVRGDRGEAQ